MSRRAPLPWIFVTCDSLPWGLNSLVSKMGLQMLHGFLHSVLGCWSLDEGSHRSQEWAGDGGVEAGLPVAVLVGEGDYKGGAPADSL